MTQKTDNREFSRVIYRAYLREDSNLHTGEALLLACLVKAKSKSRAGSDMEDIRRIMRDQNLDR